MWELAEEVCEAGRTPGQPGRLGVPANWVGEPEAGRGHPQSGEGWQAQPTTLSVALGSPPQPGALWPWKPWAVGPGLCLLLGCGTAGWVQGGSRVTGDVWFSSSVRGGGPSNGFTLPPALVFGVQEVPLQAPAP